MRIHSFWLIWNSRIPLPGALKCFLDRKEIKLGLLMDGVPIHPRDTFIHSFIHYGHDSHPTMNVFGLETGVPRGNPPTHSASAGIEPPTLAV